MHKLLVFVGLKLWFRESTPWLTERHGYDPTSAATKIGAEIAKAAKIKKVTKVAFDRSGFKYHGRVKALAEAAREGGLDF